MVSRVQNKHWERFVRMRRQHRVQNLATFTLVFLGPVLALATFFLLGPLNAGAGDFRLRLVLLADVVYVLVIAALVGQRVAKVIAARRAQSAGSRLHLRLTGVFGLLALIPTVTVAIFAVLTINLGLEAWFSERVRNAVGSSLAAAQSYEREQTDGLAQDVQVLGQFLASNENSILIYGMQTVLADGQRQVQRGLKEAYIIDGKGKLVDRGINSYLFYYEEPSASEIARALDGEVVLIPDYPNNELRALMRLPGYLDEFLYITREVDGNLLGLLDDTQEMARLYQQQEALRGQRLFEFALIYIGFALILIMAAIWMGMWFAERLSRPVGRLTGAAQLVGAGDLDVQVTEEHGDDEIAMLGRYFNQMTRQLKRQRDTLLENTQQIEARRRMFDSVLSSVTSGVVGLDPEGRVSFVNRSAEKLLDWNENKRTTPIAVAVPEFGPLFERLQSTNAETVQDEVKVIRHGTLESLLVRMSPRRAAEGGLDGYVVAFDDVTDLVSAQRMAAWGDVARRIAHEIKNPLTPIQLSAERINRKFRNSVGDGADDLAQLTGVIVRQTNDLRHIVDEFSKFARMPEPNRKSEDIVAILRDAITLQEAGMADIRFVPSLPDQPILLNIDSTMVSQALINLLKNAGEAVESLEKKTGQKVKGEVRASLLEVGDQIEIRIQDNGIGLPEDRARLFEPYVTTREKGTGLGLPIVKKIAEEHGGTLVLVDADQFEGNDHRGAAAVMRLPRA